MKKRFGLLDIARDWFCKFDLPEEMKSLVFPQYICYTSFRPDGYPVLVCKNLCSDRTHCTSGRKYSKVEQKKIRQVWRRNSATRCLRLKRFLSLHRNRSQGICPANSTSASQANWCPKKTDQKMPPTSWSYGCKEQLRDMEPSREQRLWTLANSSESFSPLVVTDRWQIAYIHTRIHP